MNRTGQTATMMLLLALALLVLSPGTASAGDDEKPAKEVSIGFIEGGDCADHQAFRHAFTEILRRLFPDGYEMKLSPSGFKSANWNRDSSRVMAAALTANKDVDIIVALGPWTVEDLLAAGCTKPIVAALRFDPLIEGLVDSTLRPVVPNLTVRVRPTKIDADISSLHAVTDHTKLGFLYFPTGGETDKVVEYVRAVAQRYGMKLFTADGFDNNGTYAFYKAYPKIKSEIDALYVSPFWGFNVEKMNQFYAMAVRDGIPLVSFGPSGQVERGALFTAGYESVRANAYFHAWKVVQIALGKKPADLPTYVEIQPQVMINGNTAKELRSRFDEEMLRQALYIDPVPAKDSVPLMLYQALDQAYQMNPGYQEQRQVLQETAAQADRLIADYLPQLHLQGDAGYRDNNSVYNRYDEITNGFFGAGLVLDQKLLSIETIKGLRTGAARLKADSSAVQKASLELEQAVSISYLNVLEAEDRLDAMRKQFARLTDIVQINEIREKLGVVDFVDHLRLREERYHAQMDLLRGEADLRACKAILNLLMGRPADTELYLDRTRYSRDIIIREYAQLLPYFGTPLASARSAEVLEAAAVQTSPGMEQARRETAVMQSRLDENRSRWLPSIGFQARVDLRDELKDNPTFKEKAATWSVRGMLDFPLFQGGDRRREKRQLAAGFERSEFKQDAEAYRVMSDVRTTVERMVAQLKSMPFAEQSTELARLFDEEVEQQYLSGKRSYLELLDGVNRLYQTDIKMLDAEYGYWREAVRLLAISGRSTAGQNYPAGVTILQILEKNY